MTRSSAYAIFRAAREITPVTCKGKQPALFSVCTENLLCRQADALGGGHRPYILPLVKAADILRDTGLFCFTSPPALNHPIPEIAFGCLSFLTYSPEW